MASRGTVLIVDDEPLNIEVLANLLEGEFEVLFAADGRQALDLVDTTLPDLILLDVVMPVMDGHEVCARLKRHDATRHIPVIFLTGQSDIASEAAGLELGAVDYLTKPFSPSLIRARVRNHIELKRARDRLAVLAMTDGLTGLANRRRFDEVLEAELRRLRRTEALLSLILLDIDHFKRFNDRYGHLAGDDCLRQVGAALAATVLRPADLVARYGGEEFACILPETSQAGALAVARAILSGVEDRAIAHADSPTADHVTVSLGLVTLRCSGTVEPGNCIAAADEQLYLAKERGRNRVVSVDRS